MEFLHVHLVEFQFPGRKELRMAGRQGKYRNLMLSGSLATPLPSPPMPHKHRLSLQSFQGRVASNLHVWDLDEYVSEGPVWKDLGKESRHEEGMFAQDFPLLRKMVTERERK